MKQQYPGNAAENGGWVTTRQAAAALHVKPRQVRNYISDEILESRIEGDGVNKRYLVSIASIQELRRKREAEGKLPGQYRDVTEAAETSGKDSPEMTAGLARDITLRLEEARYALGRAEARLELTEQAESTLRESLEHERKRADLERERADRLEAELREVLQRTISNPLEAPETAAATSEEAQEGKQQAEQGETKKQRSWFVRFFFGP